MSEKFKIACDALRKLALRINQREDSIGQIVEQTVSIASSALIEARLQGQDLLEAKSLVPYGYWLEWLKCHCPKTSRMASVYMRIALKWHLIDGKAATIRSAIALLEDERPPEATPAKRWPPDIEGIARFSKPVEYLQSHPLSTWSEEAKNKLRQQLLPITSQLWPEKFL